jgi:hypothetical protein
VFFVGACKDHVVIVKTTHAYARLARVRMDKENTWDAGKRVRIPAKSLTACATERKR